jgi:hypothetical protein
MSNEAKLAGTTWIPTTAQSLPNRQPAPRFAFLGFCERAETVTEGHVVFWKQNLLGVSHSRAFYVFPANLRGITIAIAVYQPKAGDSFKLVFRGTQGQTPFDLVMQIASAVASEPQVDAKVAERKIDSGLIDPGWVFLANQLNNDIMVNAAGTYEIFLTPEDGEEQYLGSVAMAHVPVAPYTPEEITALKSDPLATKFVRMALKCNSCHEGLKAYAGVERSPSLESQGFQWNLDIREEEFACSCGKARISLVPIKTGLHGLLRRNVSPQTQTDVSAVRLYEKTALEQYCRDLLRLIERNTVEEELQNFLESHPIFFHVFLPKKIVFKPPILTKYFADFALLNARDELLLIEIERPHLKMLKKDAGRTAGLEHAFHQVRTWKQVLDDHRAAALDAMGLQLDEVAIVKGVVVAGRKPSDERKLRMLRSLSSGDIELFTYDDLLNSVTELIKHVANV